MTTKQIVSQDLQRFRKLSEQIYNLAHKLTLLRLRIDFDEDKEISKDIEALCKQVERCYLPTQYFEDFILSTSTPGNIVTVDHRTYPSAHHAVVNEANNFLDFLWFHLDSKGREKVFRRAINNLKKHATEEMKRESEQAGFNLLHRTGFDIRLINKKLELTKEVIGYRLNKKWKNDFKVIASRVEQERALTLKNGWITNRTEDKKPDNKIISGPRLPENPKVLKYIYELHSQKEKAKKTSKKVVQIDIARNIAEGNETEAQSIVRQARRFLQLLPMTAIPDN